MYSVESTAVLSILGAWQLDHLFPAIPAALGSDARHALLIFGVSLAISLPFSTLAGAFLGLQMNQVNAVAGSVGRLLGAAGAAWAAYRHQGLEAMAWWTAGGYLLQAAMYWLAWRRLHLKGVLGLAHVTRSAVREFIHFCYAVFATQLSAVLITGLDIPIVAAFDFGAAPFYAVAATVSTMLTVPQAAVVNTIVPIASGISATASPERLGAAVLKATRYSTAMLCLLAFPVMLGMRPFLDFWVGADYAAHATLLATLLVIAQFIRLVMLPYAAIGFAAGQQHRMLYSPLGEGLINLACSLVGAHYIGAIGVALGTLVGAVAGVILHYAVSMPRTDTMRFSRLQLTLTGIVRPSLCCLPSLLLVLLLTTQNVHLPAKIAAIAGAELLSLLALWKVNFDSRERNEIAGLVLRLAHS